MTAVLTSIRPFLTLWGYYVILPHVGHGFTFICPDLTLTWPAHTREGLYLALVYPCYAIVISYMNLLDLILILNEMRWSIIWSCKVLILPWYGQVWHWPGMTSVQHLYHLLSNPDMLVTGTLILSYVMSWPLTTNCVDSFYRCPICLCRLWVKNEQFNLTQIDIVEEGSKKEDMGNTVFYSVC
jgi:hypothetical protein